MTDKFYDNRFVIKAPTDIDLNEFKEEFHKVVPEKFFPVHRANIRGIPWFEKQIQRYPWLNDNIDFFVMIPGVAYPVHTDSKPGSGFKAVQYNTVLYNPEKTVTSWYEVESTAKWLCPGDNLDKQFAYRADSGFFLVQDSLTSAPKEVFSLVTTEPVIFNATKPHGIKNKGTLPRILASWHTRFDTYEQALDYFNIPNPYNQ